MEKLHGWHRTGTLSEICPQPDTHDLYLHRAEPYSLSRMRLSRLLLCLCLFLAVLTASQAATVPLISFGATWRYLDNGTDQGTNWSQPSFNDSAWASGPAQLGYSFNPPEADEATLVGFGPNPDSKYITTYFRHTFNVSNPADYTNLLARLLLDDGAVVYLNGREAYRTNMPSGVITNRTLALSALENTLFTNSISPSLLVTGLNVLAVEVHQNIVFSTDLSFNFGLEGQELAPSNAPPSVTITAPANGSSYLTPVNVSISATASDVDGTVTSVSLYRNGALLFQTAGSVANFSWNNVPAGAYALTAVAVDDLGASSTSAPVNITVSAPVLPVSVDFITFKSAWKYHDKGSNLLNAWVQINYNDSTWSNGLAELGYGDGSDGTDIATRVEDNPTPGFNLADSDRFITTYFRKAFSVTNAAAFTNISLRLLRDDGGVVYLNGIEIFRSPNMPPGPISYTTTTLAPNGENTIDTTNFMTSGLFVEGTNVVAVEIHQQSSSSSDVSFDFSLTAIRPGETNARPLVAVSSPANGTLFGAPASFSIDAAASDPDGFVTNVAFYVNGSKAGDDTNSPFSLLMNNVPAGNYSIVAVATDNVGWHGTSAVVTVTVSANTAAPAVFNKTPAPGSVISLTNITVTFSKDVTGVNAGDLLINGSPAASVTGSGSNYVFSFGQPAIGPVSITWASAHGITDLFTPPAAFQTNTAGANWNYQLIDGVPPTIATITPTPGSTIAALTSISVTFSEAVTGVNAGDLLINATPALNVSGSGAGPYAFSFPQPQLGTVQVDWASGHGIQDLSANAFAPAPWSYTLDTNNTGIIISEIMYHPSSENVLEEYIELHNSGPASANLTGWKFTKGVSFTFPNVSIPAGGYLVVAADVDVFTGKYPAVANRVGGWTGTLNNDGEDIELEDANGNTVTSVEYADEGDWAVRQRGILDRNFRGWDWYKPHDGAGNSLELINPLLANNGGQNWAASLVVNGTPGAVNSVNDNNVAPLILEATHFPIVPRSVDPVTFSARILDEAAGGLTVSLHYRTDGTSPFTVVSMNDSGVNGDTVANDGVWSARVSAQANNTIVEFYMRAADAQNNARTWPGPAIGSPDNGVGPVGQVANALLQVDNTVYSVTNSLPLYRIVMTAAEAAELASIHNAGSSSDAQMNATFVSLDGEGTRHHYLNGVRNRGHGSRGSGNMRVSFRSDDSWKKVSAINLNVQSVHAQHFGSVLARKSGANGPAVYVAQIRVNNVNRISGPYAVVEDMNSDFVDAHYPLNDAGNLYRVIRDIAPSDLSYRGENPVSYQNTYFKQNNVSENNWSDIIAMSRVVGVNNATPFTVPNVRQVINVEQWLRHLAVMNLFGNNETGLNTGYNDDYMMYAGADGRFELLYWDLDTVLGVGGALPANSSILTMTQPNGAGAALNRLVTSVDFEPIYHRTLYELLTTTFAQTNFDALIDSTLGGYVSVATISNMKNWMNSRRSSVLGQIGVPPDVSLPTATLTGTPRSPTPSQTATFIVGGENVVAYRYSLNGAPYGFEIPFDFPITLFGLPNGTNTLLVIGKTASEVWQPVGNATARSWVVNTAIPAVRLNEVLAQNDLALNHNGTFPDAIELFNEGGSTINLGGMRLSDDNDSPNKFTFPANTFLAAGATLVVYANNNDGTPGFHLGFSLDVKGDSVHLFDSIANGGARLDSVKFGRQLTDYSIGRVDDSGDWYLTQPTFGGANSLQPLGSEQNLRINEWLAASLTQDDFVELYNANPLPAALGGLYLTDNLLGNPGRNQIEPLTFMRAGEFLAFTANGNGNGGDELNFSLALERGEIGLFSSTLKTLDSVMYGPQLPDVAQGKCPNGSPTYAMLGTATPGSPNACAPAVLPGGGVVINEVLASNATLVEADGSKPDWIELFNSSASPIDLSDMSLTDNAGLPRRWVFPNGTTIGNGAYLLIRCDSDLPASSTNTGFALKATGGSVFLFNKIANGSGLLSSIAYGLQAADFTIGRVPSGTTNWVLNIPTLGGANISATLGDPMQLKVNEWMANPISGEDDYIEIYNPNAQPTEISRFYLTDDLTARTKHQLPSLSFIGTGQGAFQLFIADDDGPAGADHVNFSLRGQGESVGLTTLSNVPIDDISFGPQTSGVSQGRVPDGQSTIVNFSTTPTPGRSNFRPLGTILINELLSHSDPPLEDAVELYNPTDEPVDISGWFLSDSQNDLRKFRIPTNTFVPAGGYVVFYEYQFNSDLADQPFSFSSAKGDEIYLAQTITNALTGYRAFASFDAAENGVSFGRFPTSLGSDFTAMSLRTFGVDNPATTNDFRSGTGLSNAYPKVGPLVINELMYHPAISNDALEFVELRNITAAPVSLFDTANPSNTWRLRKGIDFNFPQGVTIPAGGYVVVVSFDPATAPLARADFEAAYGTNMALFGPYSGKLDNAGESVELQKPDAPETAPGPDFGLVPHIVADRVVYSDRAPWPASPDGTGDALKKTASNLYGNEPLNWLGGTPTPGAANFASTTNNPPSLSPISDRSVHVGYPVTFTASAIDTDLPAQVLLFSLDAPVPPGASIGSGTGQFTWTPATNQGPATYTITVRVTDNGTPALSATQTFQIAVLGLPRVSSVEVTNGMINISWASHAGRRYRVLTTTNLTNPAWTQIGDDILANGALSTLSVLAGSENQRFYQVVSFDN